MNQSKKGDLINRNSAQRVQTSSLECIFSLRAVAGHKKMRYANAHCPDEFGLPVTGYTPIWVLS